MSFSPRTTDPALDRPAYWDWSSTSVGQCVWYTFGRCRETAGCVYPGVQGRPTSGSIDYAKNMFANPNTIYEWYSSASDPHVGDVVCWNGPYGHVANIEGITSSGVYISDYNKVATETFGYQYLSWSDLYSYNGSGNFQGYIHNPYTSEDPEPTPTPSTQSYSIISNNNNPSLASNLSFSLNVTDGTTYFYWGESSSVINNRFSPTVSGSWCSYLIGDTFEALMKDTTSKTFYLSAENYATSSGETYKRYTQSPILATTITVPTSYAPTIVYSNQTFDWTYKDKPICGYSNLTTSFLAKTKAPSGYTNSATIKSDSVSFSSNAAELSVTGTTSGTIVASTEKSNADYNLIITGTVSDSRGMSSTVYSDSIKFWGYHTPYIVINYIERVTDSETSRIHVNFNLSIALESLSNKVLLSDIIVLFEGVEYTNLVELDSEGNYDFYVGEDLDPSENFVINLKLRDDVMKKYDSTWYTTSADISERRTSFSLLETEKHNVGAAFGTTATEESVVEFAPFISLKATNLYTNESITKSAYDVLNGAGNKLYVPVGFIIMSTVYYDPTDYYSGTWTQLQDTFLWAAGPKHAAGTTGGEDEHTLTVAEMPSHSHQSLCHTQSQEATQNEDLHTVADNAGATYVDTTATGGGQAHNNMPPYRSVYMWEKISDE